MGVLALVLILFSVGVYALLARKMYRDLDDNLKNAAEGITVSMLRKSGEGGSALRAASDALDEHIGADRLDQVHRRRSIEDRDEIDNLQTGENERAVSQLLHRPRLAF